MIPIIDGRYTDVGDISEVRDIEFKLILIRIFVLARQSVFVHLSREIASLDQYCVILLPENGNIVAALCMQIQISAAD